MQCLPTITVLQSLVSIGNATVIETALTAFAFLPPQDDSNFYNYLAQRMQIPEVLFFFFFAHLVFLSGPAAFKRMWKVQSQVVNCLELWKWYAILWQKVAESSFLDFSRMLSRGPQSCSCRPELERGNMLPVHHL